MHSPKFPLKVTDISSVINVSRLKSTWKYKVREAMRRQSIPDPLEHLDFHTKLDAMCRSIESEVYAGSYIPQPPTRLLAEKSRGLCRQLVIPTVKDALILQTLSDALWGEIRSKAPSENAYYAPSDHQFSKARRGHSREYGSLNAWIAFQERIFGFTSRKPYIVITDVANYFDFISHEHLRNVLADLSLAREHSLDLLLYALSYMTWQPDYMPRIAIGLPQANLDAPRLLAHSFLFDVDKVLLSKRVEFARYMDDIDIGVDSISEAKEVLRDLDLSLQTRQLRLNSGKTKIMSEAEARQHFKIRENALLDNLASRIDLKLRAGISLTTEAKLICWALERGLRDDHFISGNGDKILKRLINLGRQSKCEIADKPFWFIIVRFPSLRSTALAWWLESADPEQKLSLIAEFLEDGGIVDDAAVIDVAVALTACRLTKSPAVEAILVRIVAALDLKSPWHFYAKAWILSKYGSDDDLMRLIDGSVSMWVTREPLSRLVGGLSSRFAASPHKVKYEAIIRRAGTFSSQAVLHFHSELQSRTAGYKAVKKFISATNPSLPNRITHAKFLMLLSVLHNKTLPPSEVSHLKTTHNIALSDDFYSAVAP